MTPCRFDFYLPTNGDYVEEISFRVNGLPLNLTGVSFRAQVRTAYDSDVICLSLDSVTSASQQGFFISEAVNGVMQLRINRESVLSLYNIAVPASYIGRTVELPYDALVTLSNGDIEQWFGGYMILNKGVTQ